MSARVVLAEPDLRWPQIAAEETTRLRGVLGAIDVHHVGSTAVPGLVAKPVVDLLPVVADLALVDGERSALEAIGLVWRGEYGIPGRRYLVRSQGGVSTVHVHVFARGHPDVDAMIAFRDALRASPALTAAYADLKRSLAVRFAANRSAYQDGKAAFIADAVRGAVGSSKR